MVGNIPPVTRYTRPDRSGISLDGLKVTVDIVEVVGLECGFVCIPKGSRQAFLYAARQDSSWPLISHLSTMADSVTCAA